MQALRTAATGMAAQQLNVEVISNNIANLNTTAFKGQRAEFQDLLYQNERNVGANSSDTGTLVPVGVQIGTGVKAAAVYRISPSRLYYLSRALRVPVAWFFDGLPPIRTGLLTKLNLP